MKRKSNVRKLATQLIEYLLLFSLFILSYDIAGKFIYNTFFPLLIINDSLRYILIALVATLILGFNSYFNLMDQSYSEILKKIVVAGFLLNTVFIGLIYFTSNIKLPVTYFIAAYVLQICLYMIFKLSMGFLNRKIIKNSYSLVITEKSSECSLMKSLQKRCKGRLTIISEENKNLREYVEQSDNIYLTGSVTRELRNKVIYYCSLDNKKVFILPEIFEIAVKNASISYIGDTPVFFMGSFHLTEAQKCFKRMLDIVFSILGLVMAIPIFIFVMIGIKSEDSGPIFYKQMRCGLNGKPFEVIKFRSMVVDAEKDSGAVLATENDRRITKIGKIMRSARIDEIPQFFNVLIGNMSLVGPRPERPVFVEEFCGKYTEYHYRFAVKPGITGLAQVKGSYTTTAENKMKFDLLYIINYSLLMDIKILFQTVKVVLKREQSNGFVENINAQYVPMYDRGNGEAERRMLGIMKLYDHLYQVNQDKCEAQQNNLKRRRRNKRAVHS